MVVVVRVMLVGSYLTLSAFLSLQVSSSSIINLACCYSLSIFIERLCTSSCELSPSLSFLD